MPTVVVDTTVLISGFITGEGVAAKVLEYGRSGVVALCLSREIIDELRNRLLYRRKIRKSYQYTDERVHRYCRDLEATTRLITGLPNVRVVERDPNDDMIIACALKARADYIVTRDKDLLSLGTHQGIRIVTPRQLLDVLEASSGR
jgi:putative PIN family toxin of toxin-antitoxin system